MEALVRVGTFLGILTAMLLWEGFYPRRSLVRPRQERWVTNLGLTLLNTILVRVTVGGVAYTAAVFAADQGVGLLHWRPLPGWAAAAVTLLVLDCALYVQHVLFHAVPVLWRLHRMHHADLDVDATTGLRFHPLEILLSLGLMTVLAFGLLAELLPRPSESRALPRFVNLAPRNVRDLAHAAEERLARGPDPGTADFV